MGPHFTVRGAKADQRKSTAELGSSNGCSNPKAFKFLKQKTLTPRKDATNYMFTPTKSLRQDKDMSPLSKREIPLETKFERVAQRSNGLPGEVL